ncbi:CXADR-like membrane protein [Alosa pseudoharengus]|uniref:CXADR-like membrane protein n=1 Tax=Alosa pseudoharengus TaxID=34774 RepID=UPI003F8C52D3
MELLMSLRCLNTKTVMVNCEDKTNNCTLRIQPVDHRDERSYYCRITTNVEKENRIGPHGVKLSVTDLKVVAPSRVKEGDNVTLNCNTTCNLTSSPSFIWSKDGRPVEKKQINNNQLQLHPVSYEDEGSYTCAVRGHEGLPSPPYRLHVMSVESHPVIARLVGVAVCGVVGLLCVLYWLRYKGNRNMKPKRDTNDQSDGHNQHLRDTVGAQGKDNHDNHDNSLHYASLQFRKDDAAKISPDRPEGEPSVIYSSLQIGV